VVHDVVRHADRAHLARLMRLNERAPGAAAGLIVAIRRMDQVSVEVRLEAWFLRSLVL
jgi:hypothetical protein